nr:uncharacterized mitochondrial protein AtMg00810-like [Tanacetum cinerariifolium]
NPNKGQPKLGLWCPRDSPFNLEAYSDSDYARANLDRKSLTGVNLVKQIHAIVNGKAMVISESSVRSDLLFNDEDGDRPRRQETTSRGVDAQTRFETSSKKSRTLPLSEVNTSGSREDRMEHPDDLTDFVPPTPHDSPLSGDHIPGSDADRPNLLELMNTCTQLSNKVLALDEAQTIQDKVITGLKLRVKRLEKKRKVSTSQPLKRRLFKGRVKTFTDKSLEDKGSSEKGSSTADQVSTARLDVSAASVPVNTLIKLRSEKAKVKGAAFRDVEEPPRLTRLTTTLQPLLNIDPKDKEDKGSSEKGSSTADQVSTARLDVSAASVPVNTLIKLRSEKAKVKGAAFRDVEEPPRLTRLTTTLQPLLNIDPKDKAQRIYEEELAELDRAQKEEQKQEEATIAVLTR